MIQGAEMVSTPAKLRHDAIVEALCEIQFDHEEVPEVVIGGLAKAEYLKGYKSTRQPAGTLPVQLLGSDPNLRFQPTLQLERPEPGEIVRIGPRVISLHLLSPYPGWEVFLPRLEKMVASLYDVLGEPFIYRIGLRYVNALTPAQGFDTIADLTLELRVRGERPSDQFLTGYSVDVGDNTRVQTKVASLDFVAGPTVEGAIAYIDVDMQTVAPPGRMGRDDLKGWLVEAHKREKSEFFRLWPEEKIEAAKV